MSYRKTYLESVPYSGVKTVHYPASKYGGVLTVDYAGLVPFTVNIDVNTAPFERSVHDTQASLNVVAGAVTAAEAAQVAEIAADADAIAETTIRGFFRVLASELSAKVSEFANSMRSCVGLICGQAKQLERTHEQMKSDYEAIKGRYLRIFTGLDHELDMRIRELDRPSFFICKSALTDVVVSPYKSAAAKALTVPADVDGTLLKLMCARTKQVVSSSLCTLGDVCDYITDYDRTVSSMMSSERSEKDVLMPVVYEERLDLDTGSPRIVAHTAIGSTETQGEVSSRIAARVATTPEGSWREPAADDVKRIEQHFMSLLDDYRTSHADGVNCERTCQKILELYRQDRPTCAFEASE